MLLEYSPSNFKAFAEQQRLKFKPITLIFGQNSSGKSSFLQSLLLLKQTMESSENPDTLLLPKGNLVDLGGFREFIHAHDVKRPLVFDLRISTKDSERYLPPIVWSALQKAGISQMGLRIKLEHDDTTSAAKLGTLEFHLGDCAEPLIVFASERRPTTTRHLRRYGIIASSSGANIAEMGLRAKSINPNHPFLGSLWDVTHTRILKEVIPELEKQKDQTLRQLTKYRPSGVNGMEEVAKRPVEVRLEKNLKQLQNGIERLSTYTTERFVADLSKDISKTFLVCRNFLPVSVLRDDNRDQLEIFGYFDYIGAGFGFELASLLSVVIFAASNFQRALENLLYIGPLRDYPERHYIFSGNLTEQVGKSGKMVPDVLFKRKDLLDDVNSQLESFGLGYELKVSSINDRESDLQDVFALRLYDKKTQIHTSILDVGFGISQVLPVIVQSMLSRNKTLCIEQPEIHLHPRLQADLGTLFAKCAKEPFSNQFIIETHSQHLVLRLQRLIRQKVLSPDDVAIIYVDRSDTGSHCTELRLDRDGDFIDEWPHGFFEEGYRELFS